jgi:hypothetical protein
MAMQMESQMIKIMYLLTVASGLFLMFASDSLSAEGFPSGVLGSPTGRYVLGQINQLARDQYLLDTQTGQLWRLSVYDTDNGNVALFPVPYMPIEQTATFAKVPEFVYTPTRPLIDDSVKSKKKR